MGLSSSMTTGRSYSAEFLASLKPETLTQLVSNLTQREAKTLCYDWRFWARQEQLPPPGNWRVWLLLAGRGFGKTRTINEWACERARAYPGSRGAVVAATAADARDVLIEGESGIVNIGDAASRPVYEPSKRRLSWPNGSQAIVLSADEPERFRGPQYHWAIADELAAWRYPQAWDMLLMGLRLGDDPRCAVATTPRPVPIIKGLTTDPTCVVTRGTTYDNRANLAPSFFTDIINRYEGTRLGRQELMAELLEDNPGALWKRTWLDAGRAVKAPDLARVVIAVDPTATTGGDECGIIGAGMALQERAPHLYVLEDASLHGSPDEWGRAVVTLYHKLKADHVVAEANNGGEMVSHVIQTVDRAVPVKLVHASRGKQTRAEPVSAIYEQGRGHHVGTFAQLEDEMCQWEPGAASPNRMDALVWAGSELVLGHTGMYFG